MDSNAALRRTMDSDTVVFPSYQFWANGNVVWWDLNYVYDFFKENALTALKKCTWLKNLGTRISSVHFHKAPAESDSHLVQAPIATSRGLLSYFIYFLQALRPQNPSGQALVLAILGCLARRAGAPSCPPPSMGQR